MIGILAMIGAMGSAQGAPPPRPALPEPVAFDVVGGLATRENEASVAAWADAAVSVPEVAWGAEVEWAPTAGLGLELEVGFDGVALSRTKVVLQGTLAARADGGLAHGVLLTLDLDPRGVVLTNSWLYAFGTRLGRRGSVLLVAGPTVRGSLVALASTSVGADAHATFALDVHPAVRLAWEQGLEWLPGWGGFVRSLPQLQVNLDRVGVQLGVGAQVHPFEGAVRWEAEVAARLLVRL